MNNVILLGMIFLAIGCSHTQNIKPNYQDQVSLGTALMHAKASYLKGCVDGYRALGVVGNFDNCRDKAQKHLEEIQYIMDQDPKE